MQKLIQFADFPCHFSSGEIYGQRFLDSDIQNKPSKPYLISLNITLPNQS